MRGTGRSRKGPSLSDMDSIAAGASAPLAPAGAVTPGRGKVLAWGLWDWGSAAFNAVATTFVFTRYITSDSFGSNASTSAALGFALGAAGLFVALTAPVTGQRTDASARRKLWLAVNTAIVVVMLVLMAFVQPDPAFFWFGIALLAIGTVFYELASVNYNAMLSQVSTPRNVGKVSGFGWSMGYFGGIVLLVILLILFIPPFGILGLDSATGVRVAMAAAGVWFLLSALPVLFAVPENRPDGDPVKVGIAASYRKLFSDIGRLWREARHTVYFLIASAVFRDGLTGVFTFGGVLAAGTFGFSASEVIIFGIAANIVAGIATVSSGALDDRFGAKPLIVVSLVGLIICGTAVFFLHGGGQTMFWIFGLLLCLFVGPAQSASRTFLARVIPPGREGEVFGLYATTGRAATFIAPTLFGIFVALGGAQYWGILAIVLVLLVGLLLLLPVRAPQPAPRG